MRTHQPADQNRFLFGVKELLYPTLNFPQTMDQTIRGTRKIPQD
jgi:hypothetical protein